jgi:hypothetical protein
MKNIRSCSNRPQLQFLAGLTSLFAGILPFPASAGAVDRQVLRGAQALEENRANLASHKRSLWRPKSCRQFADIENVEMRFYI